MTGAFDIVEILESGAYGTVCVARRRSDRRLLALKVTRADLTDARTLRRARDEARMLARVHHPHIVRVDDLYQHQGRPIVVMEYIRGASLRQVLRHHPSGLPGPAALHIVRQVALALDAAYNTVYQGRPLRLVHRDIKPSNVLLSATGEVKVVDFGTARAEFDDREAETVTVVMGSAGYVAPERYEGVQDSPAGDVYALGILLFELATGKPLVLSRSRDLHETAVLRHLKYVDAGLEGPALEALHRLLTGSLAFDWRQRPSPVALAAHLAALAPEDPALLPEFAAQSVPLVQDARKRVPPREHPHWPSLRFLEDLPLDPP